ncbi:PRK06851 family protein [Bacillus sp. JJ722]|uniref:PRK06851 family protein n=1 Tax=Bacillus sp. JJ722 TaxID=3122973 RepID=UPI002FFF8957
MTERILHYFAGGNTARGFYSLYEYNLAGLKKLFILKGGPRTGKSTLMKNIGQYFDDKGYSLQYLHCSSDNDSIDGVIINELGVGIVEGTAPHILQPRLLGTIGQYVNIEEAWDADSLTQQTESINSLMEQIATAFQSAYDSFAKALSVHDEWEAIYIDNMDFDKADELTTEMIDKLFGKQTKQSIADVRHRFLGAATPIGAVDYVPNLTSGLQHRYFIKGRPGSGKSTMLKKIAAQAEDRGFDVEVYHCGFDPNSLDMVIVRDLSFAIFDSTAPHEYFPSRDGDVIIDVYERCIRPGTDEDYSTDIENVSRRYRAKMNEATAHLARAKALQDDLEKMYVASMDFAKIERIQAGILKSIESMKVK